MAHHDQTCDCNRSDEQLVHAFYEGDDDAFAELWQRYYEPLANYARKQLPCQFKAAVQIAEEASSECLMKVLATKSKPSSRWNATKRSVAVWMRAIVRNHCRDLLRRKPNHAVAISDLRSVSEDGRAEQTPAVADHRVESEAEAVATENQRRQMWDAIERLPAELRQIMHMKANGLAHKEIAKVMGHSSPTITRRVKDAKRQIRQFLGLAA